MLIELAKDAGLEPKKQASTNGGEYASACPRCGGTDRFRLWPKEEKQNCTGAYWCRQCRISGDSIQFCLDFLDMGYLEAIERLNLEKQIINGFKKIKPVKSYVKPLKTKTSKLWQEKMTFLVERASKTIFFSQDLVDYLKNRGISEEAIMHYKLGYQRGTTMHTKTSLGLEEDGKRVYIPQGLTIPTLEKDQVIRLKIRRKPNDLSNMPKYIAVTGSLAGLNIIGDRTKKTVIVVESELDALAIHWVVKEKAVVIAIGGNVKKPYGIAYKLAKEAKRLLILHDLDEGGDAMINTWQKLYPHAIAIKPPVGKDIGESYQQRYDVKKWLHDLFDLAN